MRIRPARPDEADALTDLAMRSKASWGYDPEFMERVRPDMIVSADDIEPAHCLIADDDDGHMYGYVLTFIDGETAHLRDLFIDPAHQRRGLGRELFDHAVAHARAMNALLLRLHADPNAQAFYEQLGMRVTAQVASIIGNGRMLPVMELDLRDEGGQP